MESSDSVAVVVVGAYAIDTSGTYHTWVEIPVSEQSAGVYRLGAGGPLITVPSGSGRNITTNSEIIDTYVYFRITINGTETVTMGSNFHSNL